MRSGWKRNFGAPNLSRRAEDENVRLKCERTYVVIGRHELTRRHERSETEQKNIMAKLEQTDANLSPAQETLRQLWEEHVRYEFSTRNTEDTLATMVEDAYVNHIPVLTGALAGTNCASSTRNGSFLRCLRTRK